MSSQYYKVQRHVVSCQHIREYPHATAKTQEDELHLAVKQYIPLDNERPTPGDLTIIACHGVGFAKELYEPVWDELYTLSKSSNAFRIRAIWATDMAGQGESGILNEAKLGNDPSWFDHARDLLCMVNQFKKEMPLPLVGFGHSMGAAQIALLGLLHPRLLSAVILIDPPVYPRPSARRGLSVAYDMTFKPDTWPSRSEAEISFEKTLFYRDLDPRVKELLLKHALRQVSKDSSTTTLTTSKHQEALTVARPAYPSTPDQSLADFRPSRSSHPDIFPLATSIYMPPIPFYRPETILLFKLLPNLRPDVLYVSPSASRISSAAVRAEVINAIGRGVGGNGGLDEGAVEEVIMDGSDHFVPLKSPLAVARVMSNWLGVQTKKWQVNAEEWELWKRLPDERKRTVDEHWETWMQRHFGRKRSGKGLTPRAKI